MGAGVLKKTLFSETQNGIYDVYIRHKGTEDNLS